MRHLPTAICLTTMSLAAAAGFVAAVCLASAIGAATPATRDTASRPVPPQPARIEVTLTRSVANVEFARSTLVPPPPEGGPRLPAMTGHVWLGRIVRRLPGDIDPLKNEHFVSFVAEYVDGAPARAWCDTNFDGRLDDLPPVSLVPYPGIEGARSFLVHLTWTAGAGAAGGDRPVAVDRTLRVVLEPTTGDDPGAPPRYRQQSVFAMTGTVALEGKPHRLFLFDGDGDGIYTRSLSDGLFVDLDDDGHFLVDPMGPEFGSFSVPFTLGATSYAVVALDPEGRQVALESRGPGVARPPSPAVGRAAPDFSFTATDGREVRLSSLRGHPVLIYFWASFCRTCTSQAGDLRRLYDSYHGSGLEIVGISYDTDRSAMDAFRSAHDQTWPTSFSGHQLWEDPVGRLYRERGTGVLYLVDPAGMLVQTSSNLASIESSLTLLVP
ncbi:MAG TPA: TlpA disulfide reductase family protein [Patescibacteria group bacterium]|nr:TlpA disulfide reductase family protein [Patescibacteria group bacterium]